MINFDLDELLQTAKKYGHEWSYSTWLENVFNRFRCNACGRILYSHAFFPYRSSPQAMDYGVCVDISSGHGWSANYFKLSPKEGSALFALLTTFYSTDDGREQLARGYICTDDELESSTSRDLIYDLFTKPHKYGLNADNSFGVCSDFD